MARKNPYSLSNKRELLRSLCVYLDVLGFKEMADHSLKNKKQDEFFDKYYKAITEKSGIIKRDEEDAPFLGIASPWQQKIFTDNIVLGYPLTTKDGEGEFGHLILELSYIQMSLALEGIFIRGGFSVGQLYIDDLMAFGDALIDAYIYESEKANNPRVIISDGVMTLIKEHFKYYGGAKNAPYNNDILVDTDNKPFVNYLITAISDENFVYDDVLQIHKENVEKNLKDYQSVSKVWSKYLWVANYHNYFCETIKNLEGFSDDLFIDKKYLTQYPKRLSEYY